MPGHPSITHAHPIITVEAHAQTSPDAHPMSTQARAQLLPSHPANPPTNFTAGNSFGPYIYEDITTNRPHPQFLGSLSNPVLVKLDVPHYLFANHSHAHNLAHSNTTIDTFRYYLCASLARHHAYRTAYLTEATTTTPVYRTAYDSFEKQFTETLQSLLDNPDLKTTKKQQIALVSFERDLTHESFALWPHLFDRSFNANSNLIHTIATQTPSLLTVLTRHQHPLAFLTSLQSDLQTDYIDLADAADILDQRDPRFRKWCVLEQRRGEWLENLDDWIGEVRRAMREYDGDGDGVRKVQLRRQVSYLRDIGVAMLGEPVPVWDDVLDGAGFRGWRRGLALRLEGERVRGERGREREARRRRMAGVRRVRAPLREAASGKENVTPVRRSGGNGGERWDPEAEWRGGAGMGFGRWGVR